MPLRHYVPVLVLALGTLGLAGCSDDPVGADIQIGSIAGTVTEAGQPVSDIRVEISAAGTPFQGTYAWVQPDSTGHFRFDVANGLYMFTTTELGSDVITFFTEDTVRVNSNVVPLDFTFGRADIVVDLPPELEGRHGLLRLWGTGSGQSYVPIENGRATFTPHRLRPGSYSMQVSAETLPLELPGSLEVGTDSPATFSTDLSGAYAVLKGSVTGAWQTWDTSRPRIQVFTPDSISLDGVTPDDEGNFTVEVLEDTRFLLGVDSFEGLDFLVGGSSLATATQFHLHPGDHLTGVEIREAGIRVTLRGPGGMIHHQPSARLIDPQGTTHDLFSPGNEEIMTMGGLAPGRYYLQVHGYKTGQTWAAQWYGGADSLAAATPIDVSAGEAVDLVMDLEPGGSISGQALIGGSVPLADIPCALYDADGLPLMGNECRNWTDFPTGACTFTGLPDGRFYLAGRLGGTPVWYPGTTDIDARVPITISDHGAVSGLTWDLFPDKEERP